jgi:hypothetical protein
MRALVLSVFVALLAAGCSDGKSQMHVKTGGPGGSGAGDPDFGSPNPLDPTHVPGRLVRRLRVSQLRATFPVVFGNDAAGKPITWMVNSTTSGFDFYRAPLGEPDYLNTTDETAEVSALYVKFIDDAARDACNRALTADNGRADPNARVLIRHTERTATYATDPAGIDANLRYLRLRFHNIPVTPGDDSPITGLRQVFNAAVSAATASPSIEGWRAVCVALVTAPEFSIY